MSTRGYIAIEFSDGSCKGFYNHFDNYPEGTGKTLLTSPGCATGDIEYIQKILENTEHEWKSEFSVWTKAFAEGSRHGCDWFYLRRDEVWYCCCYFHKDLGLIPVAEALIQEVVAPWREECDYIKSELDELKEKLK